MGLVKMKSALVFLLLGVMLSACQTTSNRPRQLAAGEFDSPIQPGQTRLSLRNYDRDKWVTRGLDTSTAARTVYVCRPLACSAATSVVYSRISSPTRKPDPQALSEVAKRSVERVVADGATILDAPRVVTFRGFPAYEYAYRKEIGGKLSYVRFIAVFSGGLAFSFTAISVDDAASRRALSYFKGVVEIKDGGPRNVASR